MSKQRTVRRQAPSLSLFFDRLEPRELPAVIISEIMYNPASTEGPPPNRVEWVELYNNGAAAVTLAGVYLTDITEGSRTGQSGSFTVTIPAKSAVVLFPDSVTLPDFRSAWGANVGGVPIGKWGRNCLALDLCLRNSTGTTDGEHLQLHRSDGTILDEVNYRTTAPWPQLTTQGGPSIYLKANALNAIANDSPANWAASAPGVARARNNAITAVFNRTDTGSPASVGTSAVLSMTSSRAADASQASWRSSGQRAFFDLNTSHPATLRKNVPPAPSSSANRQAVSALQQGFVVQSTIPVLDLHQQPTRAGAAHAVDELLSHEDMNVQLATARRLDDFAGDLA